MLNHINSFYVIFLFDFLSLSEVIVEQLLNQIVLSIKEKGC